MLSENEHLLLHVLLHHGGICNSQLSAQLLGLTERRARDILLDLSELGYVRRTYLEAFRDTKNYWQITRKSARLLGHPGTNTVRSGMDAGWVLRGLTRFWFRANYPLLEGAQFLHGRHEIEATFEALSLRSPGAGRDRDRFAETIVSAGDGTLEAWSFPAVGRPLRQHIEGVVLRYADTLPTARLGWVIDKIRADELRRILSEIAGCEIPVRKLHDTDAGEAVENLLARQQAARTVAEKLMLQQQIDALRGSAAKTLPEPKDADPLSAAFLPVIVHDLV